MEEELGDLLLQVVFHAQIAKENGDFDIEDVARGISDKLIELILMFLVMKKEPLIRLIK